MISHSSKIILVLQTMMSSNKHKFSLFSFQTHLVLLITLMSPGKQSPLNGPRHCVMEAVRLWPTALRNGKEAKTVGSGVTLLMSVNANIQLQDSVQATDMNSECLQETLLVQSAHLHSLQAIS